MDRKDGRSLIGIEEARSLGVHVDKPPVIECQWCGKLLEPLGAIVGDRFKWLSHRPCGCDGEVAHMSEEAERKRRAARKAMMQRLEKAGVPRRYASSATDNPLIAKWIEGFNVDTDVGLYISGCKGSGKTMSASAIARALIFSGYDVVMTEARAMFGEIKATFDTSETEASAMRPFLKCDLLIVDELGKESAREWASNTMFDIVNGRYKDMRPIVFCSQHRLQELPKHLSRSGEVETAEAICSRIRETCPEVWLGDVDRRESARLQP